jgi:tRNA-specific 2-thiouridylase
VTFIDPETNTVMIGKEEELLQHRMQVRGVNLGKYATLPDEMPAVTKIRYKDVGAPSVLHPLADGLVEVTFPNPVKAITPGQSAVFYEGEDVLGGGWIKSVGGNSGIFN